MCVADHDELSRPNRAIIWHLNFSIRFAARLQALAESFYVVPGLSLFDELGSRNNMSEHPDFAGGQTEAETFHVWGLLCKVTGSRSLEEVPLLVTVYSGMHEIPQLHTFRMITAVAGNT